jgi:hypothetical protein
MVTFEMRQSVILFGEERGEGERREKYYIMNDEKQLKQ